MGPAGELPPLDPVVLQLEREKSTNRHPMKANGRNQRVFVSDGRREVSTGMTIGGKSAFRQGPINFFGVEGGIQPISGQKTPPPRRELGAKYSRTASA